MNEKAEPLRHCEDCMSFSKEPDGLPEALKDLPRGSVVSVIGAGGKTTAVHQLAARYRSKGLKVLVTTTTHMMIEEPLKESRDEIVEALEREGFAFAASRVIHKGHEKAGCLPDDILKEAIAAADMTFIEADGARRLPFKVPKADEPVIIPETTLIVLVAGMKAAGKTLAETVYNYEALTRTGYAADAVLTPRMMAEICREVFLSRVNDEWPAVPVIVLAGQADTPERQDAALIFLQSL